MMLVGKKGFASKLCLRSCRRERGSWPTRRLSDCLCFHPRLKAESRLTEESQGLKSSWSENEALQLAGAQVHALVSVLPRQF